MDGKRWHVGRRHDFDNARMCLGGVDIEGGDAAAIVSGITRGAGHLQHAFAPGHWLADIGAVADMGRGNEGHVDCLLLKPC